MSSQTTKRGRPKGSGNRATEALAIVRNKPGITVPEIADQMGIKQNYLYRVLPGLAEDGLVRKDGRDWYPVDGATPSQSNGGSPAAAVSRPPSVPVPVMSESDADDLLARHERERNERMAELRPLVDEYTKLEKAAAALTAV